MATTLTITLPAELLQLVSSKVATGPYRSAEEVVQAALRRLGEEEAISRQLQARWEREERMTAEAYARQPDSTATYVDPEVWE